MAHPEVREFAAAVAAFAVWPVSRSWRADWWRTVVERLEADDSEFEAKTVLAAVVVEERSSSDWRECPGQRRWLTTADFRPAPSSALTVGSCSEDDGLGFLVAVGGAAVHCSGHSEVDWPDWAAAARVEVGGGEGGDWAH